MNVSAFKKKPIMGILRGGDREIMATLVETVISAGLETIELTMNTPGASEMIREAVKTSRGRMMVGAGTVLTMESLKTALDAGATFIVMPTLVKDVVRHCVKNKIPVFPGALTPQEIYNAWNTGATMIKVFPSGFFGSAYFKEIKGPFNDIELMACGGVTPENLKDFFSAGASAAAFGGSVFRKEWLNKKDIGKVGESVKKIIQVVSK